MRSCKQSDCVVCSHNRFYPDSQRNLFALKAIRRLKSEFVKQEVYADTSPCGLADAVYADAESNEICAMEREGPINKCLLDDILHITKDRSSFKRLDPAQGAGAENEWLHLLEEIEITVVPLRGFDIDADECLSAGPAAVRQALRR